MVHARPFLSAISVAAFLLLAGCAGSSVSTSVKSRDYEPQQVSLVPDERPVVWEVQVEEVPRGDQDPYEGSEIKMTNERKARKATLEFNGVHEVYDEWGRSVPAQVFRYEAMELDVETKMTGDGVTSVGFEWEGTWRPHLREFLFDAADGRFLGSLDVKAGTRAFTSADSRSPMASGLDHEVFTFMALEAMGGPDGNLTLPTGFGGTYTMGLVPATDRPLEGRCDVYRWVLLSFDDPALEALVEKMMEEAAENQDDGTAQPQETEEPEGPVEGSGSFVCLDGGDVPAWTWSGASSDEGLGHVRASASPDVTPFEGDVLAPLVYEKHAWESAGLIGGVDDTLVPPVDHEGDWASRVSRAVTAVPADADYAKFHAERDPYVSNALFGFPLFPLLVPGAPTVMDGDSWLFLTDEEEERWEFMADAQSAGAPYPVAHRGATFDAFMPYPVDKLPEQVAIGEVTAALGDLARDDASFLDYWTLPYYEDLPAIFGNNAIMWISMDSCFEPAEGAKFTFLSGINGQMLAAGEVRFTDGGCSAGASMEVPGPEGPVRLELKSGEPPIALLPDGEILLLG